MTSFAYKCKHFSGEFYVYCSLLILDALKDIESINSQNKIKSTLIHKNIFEKSELKNNLSEKK